MEKKQTAVEWFYTKLITGKFTGKDTIEFLYETAKQMEKEQILDSWDDGYSCGMYQEGLGIHYYNETYLGIIKKEE